MKYCKGYKYQLAEDEVFATPYRPEKDIVDDFIHLAQDGTLTVKKGFAWDGPSGPTFDRSTNMRGSLGHDALYKLIRKGYLPFTAHEQADDLILRWWIEDGMVSWVAKLEVAALRDFGDSAARPHSEPKVYQAP